MYKLEGHGCVLFGGQYKLCKNVLCQEHSQFPAIKMLNVYLVLNL